MARRSKKALETQKLHFAGEIAACAFFKHLTGATREMKARYFMRKLVLGYLRAASCVNSLVIHVLADRFGR